MEGRKNAIKKLYDWECVANHLPEWIEELDMELLAVMSNEDYTRIDGMIERYNELIDTETENSEDGSGIFGIEAEKEELIRDMVKIYEKYFEQAVTLSKSFEE